MANSYVDDINVKISENYKPPCRISLPMTYSQRLTLNKELQDTRPNYDFHVEKSVMERLKEVKKHRRNVVEGRQQRIEQAREEFNQKIEKEKLERVEEIEPPIDINQQQYQTKNGILMPIQASQAAFSKQTNQKPFNLSDFESDTSSPFDNMELKSINDLEELAQVLKTEKSTSSVLTNYPVYSNTSMGYNYTPPTYNQYNYNQTAYSQYSQVYGSTYPVPTSSQNGYIYPGSYSHSQFNVDEQPTLQNCKSVPDLVKELESTQLTDKIKLKQVPDRPRSTDLVYRKKASECLEKLSSEDRDTCQNVSLMGFPLDRVVRVCETVGGDQKKIVDHLLALTDLLDLGFAETAASEALHKNNNDRDKALDLLIS